MSELSPVEKESAKQVGEALRKSPLSARVVAYRQGGSAPEPVSRPTPLPSSLAP